MIQYLHKISGEITETTQCIITIGEHQEIFKMILSHHRGSFHEEIQCYGKIDRENENIILIVDKIYKMNLTHHSQENYSWTMINFTSSLKN